MAFWNFKSNKQSTTEILVENKEPLLSKFSTPFGTIGDGNLSLPYIRAYGSEPYVRFGGDNLYPQVINQMYYQSPLNSSIINFKTNAVIGGGFELQSLDTSAEQQIKELVFLKKNKFRKVMRQATKDLIMHGRICLIIDNTGKDVKITRVGPEKVRTNRYKTLYTVSDDWSIYMGMVTYPRYDSSIKAISMYVYETDCDAGQDYYPIPSYCSALNWSFVDGQSAYLHKSNIINSIFPSFMITVAKKFSSDAEKQEFADTVNNAKGAPNAGRILAFANNDAAALPTITSIPTQQNDKLFTQTDERIDANISRAHSIDPLLVGIRVSGKLGSGTDITIAYQIFEKNIVMPLREMITEFGDEILEIANLNSTIIINDYQIINNVIVDTTENTID